MTHSPVQTGSHGNHTALAWLLVVSLIFAQWLGLTHSIVHTTWGKSLPHNITTSIVEQAVEGTTHHSCAIFDHATLGATISTLPFCLVRLPGKHLLALWQAFASWNAPFVCHFLSRAPPDNSDIS